MENEDDGSARDVRIERNKPTKQEEQEFRVLMVAITIVMLCTFGMGIVGSMMIFWRIWG